jgi:ADP-ribosylglycohydrolase
MFTKENIINALRCMAVGDAVGDKFEFMNSADFSPSDILNYAKTGSLEITDDTQMTLFGFESILSGHSIVEAYLDWFITQTEEYDGFYDWCLLDFPELFKNKSPGNTCISSLADLSDGYEVVNNSYGCGSVMRLLPFALVDFNLQKVIDSIEVTHKHPVLNLVAANRLIRAYRGEIFDYVAKDIEVLGQGWVATECVDMAIWAVENSKTFDELLVKSIHHSGDSDSVAAIACSIWGLRGREFSYYDNVVEKAPIEYIIDRINEY